MTRRAWPLIVLTVWAVGCGEATVEESDHRIDGSVGTDGAQGVDGSNGQGAGGDRDARSAAPGADATPDEADDGSVDAGPRDASSTPDAAEDTGPLGCAEPTPAPFVGLVEATNAERSLYGAPPLCWDAELAQHAREYGEGCVWAHDPTREFRGSVAGENLAASTSPSATPTSLNQLWLDEASDWSCVENSCRPGEVCGHYTQMIWGDSGIIGCGLVACPSGTGPFGGASWTYLVCRYFPPGNWVGRRPVPVSSCP